MDNVSYIFSCLRIYKKVSYAYIKCERLIYIYIKVNGRIYIKV